MFCSRLDYDAAKLALRDHADAMTEEEQALMQRVIAEIGAGAIRMDWAPLYRARLVWKGLIRDCPESALARSQKP